MNDKFVFIIDTEQYAGNFEREMAAAMIGITGEYFPQQADRLAVNCRKEMGVSVEDDNPFYEIIANAGEHNDHDSDSFVSLWETPGWWNDGEGGHYREWQEGLDKYPAFLSVAVFFYEWPPDNLVTDMIRRAKKYAKDNGITITGTRIIKEEIVHTRIWEYKL